MLVITSKVGERIFITAPNGDVIELYCVQVKNKQTRIGIKSSKDYKIERKGVIGSDDLKPRDSQNT